MPSCELLSFRSPLAGTVRARRVLIAEAVLPFRYVCRHKKCRFCVAADEQSLPSTAVYPSEGLLAVDVDKMVSEASLFPPPCFVVTWTCH